MGLRVRLRQLLADHRGFSGGLGRAYPRFEPPMHKHLPHCQGRLGPVIYNAPEYTNLVNADVSLKPTAFVVTDLIQAVIVVGQSTKRP